MKIYAILWLSLLGFGCDQSAFNSSDANRGQTEESPASPVQEANVTISETVIEGQANLIDACQDPALVQSIEQTLPFPQTDTCKFGDGDNMPEAAGTMTAHEVQKQSVALPENALVCAVTLQSAADDLLYDDYFFFSLNKVLLVSSEVEWAKFFGDLTKLLPWDWNKVKGQSHAGVEGSELYGQEYCLGDENCQVPGHDATGAFAINLDVSKQPSLAELLFKAEALDFEMIVTGDDDPDDCDHSSIDLNVNISYVQKP